MKEEVNGENVKVEPNPAVPQRSHHSDAQKHPHLQRVRSIAHRDQNKAEHDVAQARKQSADSETPSRQVFKKDAITGKLRPLTKQEIRAEEADRAARREAHYCSSGTESVWEDESHIIIERKDGEDLEIRRKERSPDSRPGSKSFHKTGSLVANSNIPSAVKTIRHRELQRLADPFRRLKSSGNDDATESYCITFFPPALTRKSAHAPNGCISSRTW